MEQHWLALARRYEFTQRPGAKRQADKLNGRPSASITPFLRDAAFDPETVEAMAKAFATTCKALGLSNRDDAMTKLVAEKIIELAQRGLKNPTALHFASALCHKQTLCRSIASVFPKLIRGAPLVGG